MLCLNANTTMSFHSIFFLVVLHIGNFHKCTLWWSEWELFPTVPCIWTLGPQWVVVFGEAGEPLGAEPCWRKKVIAWPYYYFLLCFHACLKYDLLASWHGCWLPYLPCSVDSPSFYLLCLVAGGVRPVLSCSYWPFVFFIPLGDNCCF